MSSSSIGSSVSIFVVKEGHPFRINMGWVSFEENVEDGVKPTQCTQDQTEIVQVAFE